MNLKSKTLLLVILIIIIGSCKKNNTVDDGNNGTFTDPRDGYVYNTIKIGDQVWLAENLAYLPSVNSASQGSVDDPMFYVYGYQGSDVNEAKATSNYQTYGALYNWVAASQACPTGWHIPSDIEWGQLEMYLGMNQEELEDTGNRGTSEGDKLKSTSGWANNGNGNNESGFTALPGGIRAYEGRFEDEGAWGEFWSSTASGTYHNWNRYLVWEISEVGRWGFQKSYGLSVRCIKD